MLSQSQTPREICITSKIMLQNRIPNVFRSPISYIGYLTARSRTSRGCVRVHVVKTRGSSSRGLDDTWINQEVNDDPLVGGKHARITCGCSSLTGYASYQQHQQLVAPQKQSANESIPDVPSLLIKLNLL